MLELILYNNWANQQLLKSCLNLSEEQLATEIPGGYGTIRSTLEHILQGEAFYVDLLTGVRPRPSFRWKSKPGLDQILDHAVQLGGILAEAVRNTSPSVQVHEGEDGKKVHYQAMAVFIQIINHGVEHRTNITTVLNQGLLTPPGVDGWGYLSAHPQRFDYQES